MFVLQCEFYQMMAFWTGVDWSYERKRAVVYSSYEKAREAALTVGQGKPEVVRA